MIQGFIPIQLHDNVDLHVRANPSVKRAELIQQLESAMGAYRAGVRCQCGAPIWIIGSSQTGLACFTCITGEPGPQQDYEIDVAEDVSAD